MRWIRQRRVRAAARRGEALAAEMAAGIPPTVHAVCGQLERVGRICPLSYKLQRGCARGRPTSSRQRSRLPATLRGTSQRVWASRGPRRCRQSAALLLRPARSLSQGCRAYETGRGRASVFAASPTPCPGRGGAATPASRMEGGITCSIASRATFRLYPSPGSCASSTALVKRPAEW
ncbi:hypothetical protein PHLGIDRAFT_291850 [Phlebiopsis gigantea 11061_1 CR5-6]|uniref:Uncharacterized protein n=1 Tax=Phlebiopsis gigantea (strain 11061_1 CR5-6) TaxID=745531 RepID=A0A0C3PBW9_PHLG1|nr:hypothetical protein PHLGIDRAFT_291850 [Phlebiopsis gigantea 11061_1 CR5-6]